MLTADILRDIMSYCPDRGHFTWLKPHISSKVKIGQRAGCVCTDGYRTITIAKKMHKEHRLAWLYMTGEWPDHLDHINRDRADNRFCNLRLATLSQNVANRNSWNKHGLKGVSLAARCKSRPWRASIECNKNGKRIFKSLGMYETKEEAHAAFLNALRELHPEYAAP